MVPNIGDISTQMTNIDSWVQMTVLPSQPGVAHPNDILGREDSPASQPAI